MQNSFWVNFHSVLVLLCMRCSDYRHHTDTEFDGDFINFIAQIQIQGFNFVGVSLYLVFDGTVVLKCH